MFLTEPTFELANGNDVGNFIEVVIGRIGEVDNARRDTAESDESIGIRQWR